MKFDARNISSGTVINCDVAIVGSGAGGMALAVELEKSGLKVVLLESGGEILEPDTQKLYKGEVVNESNHGALDQYRKRVLGGTSTAWGGRCAPFEESDFSQRDYINQSGWPITKGEIDQYYVRAHNYCDLGVYSYSIKDSVSDHPEIIPGLISDKISQDKHWRFSLPTNFSTKFGKQIANSETLALYLHANCLKIQMSKDGGDVESLKCASLKKNIFFVKARRYVIAAGGLETTRLLLLSDDVIRGGIGSSSGLLGKYYASHLTGDFGEVELNHANGPVSWRYGKTNDGVYYKQQLRVNEGVKKQLGLLNTRVILTHSPFGDPSHHNGVLSAAYLVKRFYKGQIPPEYSRDLTSSEYKYIGQHVKNVLFDLPAITGFGYDWLTRRVLRKRKLPSIALKSKNNVYILHYDSEQTPHIDSTVGLMNEVDAFGLRKLKVDWKCHDSDIENLARTYEVISKEIEACGAGKLLTSVNEAHDRIAKQLGVGSHHLGSTRMSRDANQGVVNADCRVHDAPNLFLASPSVFCTGGFANPFLTIVALSIRIADKIRGEL